MADVTLAAPAEEPAFTVTTRQRGHAQVALQGTYTGKATATDVRNKFYHPHFGGAEEWARDGRWGCIVYID